MTTVVTYLVAIGCVIGITAGQLLFKLGATALQRNGNLFEHSTLVTLMAAFSVYGITTIAWVWVLRKLDLGRAYPLMALAFVLVPIGSYLFLGERFQPTYFFGIALIIVGIIVAMQP